MQDGRDVGRDVGCGRRLPSHVVDDWYFRAWIQADEIVPWLDAGFTDPDVVRAWCNAGVTDPQWAARFAELHLAPDEAPGWSMRSEFEVERWLAQGFTLSDWAPAWRAVGVDTPELAAAWSDVVLQEFGVSLPDPDDPDGELPVEVRLLQAGIFPADLDDWIRPGIDVQQAESLLVEDAAPELVAVFDWLQSVDVATAQTWLRMGVETVEEMRMWQAAGITDPAEVGEWLEELFDPHLAAAWRASGYGPAAAAAWSREGYEHPRELEPVTAGSSPSGPPRGLEREVTSDLSVEPEAPNPHDVETAARDKIRMLMRAATAAAPSPDGGVEAREIALGARVAVPRFVDLAQRVEPAFRPQWLAAAAIAFSIGDKIGFIAQQGGVDRALEALHRPEYTPAWRVYEQLAETLPEQARAQLRSGPTARAARQEFQKVLEELRERETEAQPRAHRPHPQAAPDPSTPTSNKRSGHNTEPSVEDTPWPPFVHPQRFNARTAHYDGPPEERPRPVQVDREAHFRKGPNPGGPSAAKANPGSDADSAYNHQTEPSRFFQPASQAPADSRRRHGPGHEGQARSPAPTVMAALAELGFYLTAGLIVLMAVIDLLTRGDIAVAIGAVVLFPITYFVYPVVSGLWWLLAISIVCYWISSLVQD